MSFKMDQTLQNNLKLFSTKKGDFTRGVLKDLQTIFLKEIKRLAPRKTGDYANSWMAGTVTPTKATVETPQGELYDILEFKGRDPGLIEPFGDVLAFEWKGTDVFFKFVNHPGFPKIPHVKPALDKTMKEVPKVIRENLKKQFAMFR